MYFKIQNHLVVSSTTTAVVSYDILRLDFQIYFKLHYELHRYACDSIKIEANLNLDSSKLFLLESKLRFDSILVAK